MPWWKNLFIVTYLIIQVTLPLRGCLYDTFESRGNFSWNMYTTRYECRGQYRLDTQEGETRWLRLEDYFHWPKLWRAVFFAEDLPEFHGWLCDKFRREGELGSLRGYTICTLNNGPEVALMDHNVDLCTAPNYGVKVQREALRK